jgi:hypothetical protein
MNLALLKSLCGVLSCTCICLVSCTAEPDLQTHPVEDAPPAVQQVVNVLATATSGDSSELMPSVTADIVDVIDGGPGGEWGVKVDFPNGTGDGCYIDVYDKRSEKLLARDEVSDSPDSNASHMVRFRYRGNIENLTIRVSEKSSGVTLAESEHR